ncbi:Recombination protein RecR [Candidatus Hepatincolaceae symbiont of Richtersius coronifer]
MQNNNTLEHAILLLSRLPSIGGRSSRRILFELMKKREALLLPLISSLQNLADNILHCKQCFNLDVNDPCHICNNSTRNHKLICVVEDISSLWALERTKNYNGIYFVLGGQLSARKGSMPQDLHIDELLLRLNNEEIEELILATSATLEGQITANYIHDNLEGKSFKISVLAQGIPVGGEIDYLDDITLSTALKLRNKML